MAQPMLMPSPMKKRDISPIWMAVAPVMTPDDRSNSPPIINSATAAAMMPVGAATSSQLSVVSASPNVRPLPQKNAQTMTAPMRAPISGEISHRLHRAAVCDSFVEPESAAVRIPVPR